jgi:hypothetical protein
LRQIVGVLPRRDDTRSIAALMFFLASAWLSTASNSD